MSIRIRILRGTINVDCEHSSPYSQPANLILRYFHKIFDFSRVRSTHMEADVELGAGLDVLVEALLLPGLHPDPVVHRQTRSHDVELRVNRLRAWRQKGHGSLGSQRVTTRSAGFLESLPEPYWHHRTDRVHIKMFRSQVKA